jgi:hypothetical protein
MSVLIRVEKLKPVAIEIILPKIRRVLMSILGLTFEPELRVTRVYKLDEHLPPSYWLRPGSTDISIMIEGEQAAASLSSPNGAEHIVISPDCWRTKLENALAVCVAIALADYSGTEISESSQVFTREFRQTANQFAEAIKSDTTFSKIDEAAQALFDRLPDISQSK